MTNTRNTLVLIVAASLLASAVLYNALSGAYVRTTANDRFTYWIGPLSTTIPFIFWAMVTLVVGSKWQQHRNHFLCTASGYVTGWVAMTAFSFWIVSFPRGPQGSSTMGIAMVLTPFLFIPIFPVVFIVAYFITHFLLPPRQAAPPV